MAGWPSRPRDSPVYLPRLQVCVIALSTFFFLNIRVLGMKFGSSSTGQALSQPSCCLGCQSASPEQEFRHQTAHQDGVEPCSWINFPDCEPQPVQRQQNSSWVVLSLSFPCFLARLFPACASRPSRADIWSVAGVSLREGLKLPPRALGAVICLLYSQ